MLFNSFIMSSVMYNTTIPVHKKINISRPPRFIWACCKMRHVRKDWQQDHMQHKQMNQLITWWESWKHLYRWRHVQGIQNVKWTLSYFIWSVYPNCNWQESRRSMLSSIECHLANWPRDDCAIFHGTLFGKLAK